MHWQMLYIDSTADFIKKNIKVALLLSDQYASFLTIQIV